MRIAHVMSYFQPQLGYQEYYLAREQRKMGHDVCVFTSDRRRPIKAFSKTFGTVLRSRYVGRGEFDEDGVKVVRLPCFLEFHDQIFVRNLRKALIDFRPDILCVHDEISYFALISLIHKIFLKLPVVMDVHADYINMSKNFLRRFVFHLLSKNPLYRMLYRRSDAYIAISKDSKEWLSNELGIKKNQIVVVPLGAEAELFSPSVLQRQQIREKYQFEDSAVLIYAGKLILGKDVELLLQAASLLTRKGLNIKVLIVGSGPENYQSKLQELVEQLRIKDIVVFRSFVDKKDLPGLYNAADIGVWPGDPSITIIEAMATGLPVVIPLLACTSHYFEYDIGFHFPRGNTVELAKRLELLVINDGVRQKKGLEARRMVVDNLNWHSINAKTIEVYRNAMETNYSHYSDDDKTVNHLLKG